VAYCRRGASKPQGAAWENWWYQSADVVRSLLDDELSTLFLPGGSTTIRHVGMPDVPWFENLLLRLKPVIKRALTDASFVVLKGACGDQFAECG
jgi:hypothetical protein